MKPARNRLRRSATSARSKRGCSRNAGDHKRLVSWREGHRFAECAAVAGELGARPSLEQLVRLVRLTRPEVILTFLPGTFIGEDHGDHQASGVLATEAFDLAGDPAVFPEQVAGPTKRLEPYLENLRPWQVKKIYYFPDADDEKKFFAAKARNIPSKKFRLPRRNLTGAWRWIVRPHLTQFPGEIIPTAFPDG